MISGQQGVHPLPYLPLLSSHPYSQIVITSQDQNREKQNSYDRNSMQKNIPQQQATFFGSRTISSEGILIQFGEYKDNGSGLIKVTRKA